MAAVNGVVEAYSTKYGWSIMVNGNWYKTKIEWAPAGVDIASLKGQTVEFDDGGRKYIKNLKVTGGAPAAPATGGAKSGTKTWNNLGVELGHASNLAMRMMEQGFVAEAGPESVGSTEYWKEFVTHTEQAYKVMKMLREKYEQGPTTKVEATPEPEVKVMETSAVEKAKDAGEDVDVSDLF